MKKIQAIGIVLIVDPHNHTHSHIIKKVFMGKEKKKKQLGSVWYMCLKTENCYLKTFVEIRVGEKVRGNE